MHTGMADNTGGFLNAKILFLKVPFNVGYLFCLNSETRFLFYCSGFDLQLYCFSQMNSLIIDVLVDRNVSLDIKVWLEFI